MRELREGESITERAYLCIICQIFNKFDNQSEEKSSILCLVIKKMLNIAHVTELFWSRRTLFLFFPAYVSWQLWLLYINNAIDIHHECKLIPFVAFLFIAINHRFCPKCHWRWYFAFSETPRFPHRPRTRKPPVVSLFDISKYAFGSSDFDEACLSGVHIEIKADLHRDIIFVVCFCFGLSFHCYFMLVFCYISVHILFFASCLSFSSVLCTVFSLLILQCMAKANQYLAGERNISPYTDNFRLMTINLKNSAQLIV